LKAFLVLMKLLSLSQFYAPKYMYFDLPAIMLNLTNIVISIC